MRFAELIDGGKIRCLVPGAQADFRKSRQRSNVDRVSIESALHGHAVAKMPLRLVLGIERVDLADRIVVKREGRSWNFGGALLRLGKGFIGVAGCIEDHARPRSRVLRLGLRPERGGGHQYQYRHA